MLGAASPTPFSIDTIKSRDNHQAIPERSAHLAGPLPHLVIKKHCSATPDQIQAAIKAYKQKQDDAEALVVGMEYSLRESLKEAKAKLRRLQSI